MEIKNLRIKYPKFIYENFTYQIINNDLEIVFSFKIEPDIIFFPKIIIENVGKNNLAKIGDNVLKNLIFHLGLIEIPSYWKTTCSPEIEIKAGYLNKNQLAWWKKILIEGMGQFYYENKIDWRSPDFLTIESQQKSDLCQIFTEKLKDRYLVPFAGGRDSIVTLGGLKKKNKEILLFTVNPIGKIQKTVKISGIKKQIVVRRIIDQKLLELNKQGFLNGHTPFTSLLSLIAVLCAVIFNCKNVAFSNEKSADEGNVKYLGKTINHQWAKSSVFEKMFADYAKEYLAQDINYFSYIRNYGELEISKKLTEYPQYFPVFSSCNAGMKIGQKGNLSAEARWCGNCPKCLFVYISLYPFLSANELKIIFGQDIFENKKLLPVLKQLSGKEGIRPLECVGTIKESQKALTLCLKKAKDSGKIPFLLTKI
jgi:UDP-N-acetyl-alpha-D-muramoyl-L-alanyl-L-glutamate epimerase